MFISDGATSNKQSDPRLTLNSDSLLYSAPPEPRILLKELVTTQKQSHHIKVFFSNAIDGDCYERWKADWMEVPLPGCSHAQDTLWCQQLRTGHVLWSPWSHKSTAGVETELFTAGVNLLSVKRPKEQCKDIFIQIHFMTLIKWTMLWSPVSNGKEQMESCSCLRLTLSRLSSSIAPMNREFCTFKLATSHQEKHCWSH